MVRKRRKSKGDDWIDDLFKLGIGALAVYFIGKALEGGSQEPPTRCPFCGVRVGKWARTCPNCRNEFIVW